VGASQESEEKGILELPGISITTAKIKIQRNTHELANVAGFQIQERVNIAAKGSGLLFIVSALLVVYSLAQSETSWMGLALSLVTMGLAVYCAIKAASIYDLVLTMDSGDVATYSWKNPKLTRLLRIAVAKAIAERK
jgi:hypothetical protein